MSKQAVSLTLQGIRHSCRMCTLLGARVLCLCARSLCEAACRICAAFASCWSALTQAKEGRILQTYCPDMSP